MGRLVVALLGLALLLAGCGDDSARAPDVVEPAGLLSVHAVLGNAEDGAVTDPEDLDPAAGATVTDPDGGPALFLGPAALGRDDVARAAVEPSRPGGPSDAVTVEWTADGAVRFAELTGAAACAPPGDPARRIAVLLDGEVLTAPAVSPAVQCDVGIEGGTTQLLGPFPSSDAEGIAERLQPGAGGAPVP